MKADLSRNAAEDKKKRNLERLKITFNQGGRQCVLGRVSDLCKVTYVIIFPPCERNPLQRLCNLK
jgi:hypothetical protein